MGRGSSQSDCKDRTNAVAPLKTVSLETSNPVIPESLVDESIGDNRPDALSNT